MTFITDKLKKYLLFKNKAEIAEQGEEAVTGEVRMDVGPIHRKLLAYAAPLLLMQLMLQFYNIADCAVLGRFGGAFGLAAVGVPGWCWLCILIFSSVLVWVSPLLFLYSLARGSMTNCARPFSPLW